MSSETNGGSWIKSSTVIVAVISQLGFTIWWAAHLDQSTQHIIEQAKQLDARVNKISDAIVLRVEKLESASQLVILIDDRVKTLQVQAGVGMSRIDAIANNLNVTTVRVDNNVLSLARMQAQLRESIRHRKPDEDE